VAPANDKVAVKADAKPGPKAKAKAGKANAE
jgi:hypothetical protein